jgi:hypothetical protein
MIPQHPDDPSNWHPEMRGDLGEAFKKLVSSIREDERVMKEVKNSAMFESRNKLSFEVAHGNVFEVEDGWLRFRIGTCAGMWRSTDDAYEILAISNDVPGNTHLQDVFDWFANSCKRDNKMLRIREVWNSGFKSHLINKRGFKEENKNDVVKNFIARG